MPVAATWKSVWVASSACSMHDIRWQPDDDAVISVSADGRETLRVRGDMKTVALACFRSRTALAISR